jgi:hypothetical protein
VKQEVFLAAKASNLGGPLTRGRENVIHARRDGSTSRGRVTGEDSHTLTMVTLSGTDWAGVPVREAGRPARSAVPVREAVSADPPV